ncbi:ChaC-like protein [Daedalea quercina L-15889]|uniref:glutathione-specific gamma-glutamylcyclotransferase n=1 Tax=Daedalea quercina L-15889 TaxID=1314783 RepID=A0A165MQ90_9APHY|nr:ChaC-like protein [Daedalea quercina L-15889]
MGSTEGRPPYVVFGYGSLIFKPPPHVTSQHPGFLKGYVRRFAQKSHDHRGTPENPGRVVTLVHKEDWDAFSGSDPFPDDDVVWGVAYTIDPEYESEVRDYLDYREKDGYSLEQLDIWGIVDGREQVVFHNAFCYVGHNTNASFIGSEPIEQLARKIWESVGPSGPNKDYLYHLAEAVRQLAPESHDSHLFALETRCRELDAENGDKSAVEQPEN